MNERMREVAATLSPDDLGKAMADRLLARIPELSATSDDDFRNGLVLSCTSNLVEIRDLMASDAMAAASSPPPGATAWARELVHRGMPLAALLRAYRLGHAVFEEDLEKATTAIGLDPDIQWRVLAAASRLTFAYIDSVCTQLVDEYEAEREQWLRGAAAAQAALVQAIVAGETFDAREATATLHYDVTRAHVGLIVWRDAGTASGHPVAPVAQALIRELDGAQTLIVPVGDHAAWAWTTLESPAGQPPSRSDALGQHAAAIGTPREGIDGMARTHHEARSGRRVAEVFGVRPGAIVRFPGVALTSLMSADPAQAVRFVADELGPELTVGSDAMMRLRATVRIYLDERMSPSRTARRLGVHENTVAYRVKRAEDLLGRPLDERRLELEIALRLYDGLEGLRALGSIA